MHWFLSILNMRSQGGMLLEDLIKI